MDIVNNIVAKLIELSIKEIEYFQDPPMVNCKDMWDDGRVSYGKTIKDPPQDVINYIKRIDPALLPEIGSALRDHSHNRENGLYNCGAARHAGDKVYSYLNRHNKYDPVYIDGIKVPEIVETIILE